MRTAACLDGANAFSGKSFVLGEELGVFAREDVVCYCGDGVFFSERVAEC